MENILRSKMKVYGPRKRADESRIGDIMGKIDALFIEGLVENNTEKLLIVPMSDLHNHSKKGCKELPVIAVM